MHCTDARSFVGILYFVLFAGLIAVVVNSSSADYATEYTCFNASERKRLTYANSEEPIYHLPSIRLLQGYWGSQTAIQYVAYLYLKEKMGVTVEWYPSTNNPRGLHLMNEDLPPADKYPRFYWTWMAAGKYDILFGTDPISNARGFGDPYYADGRIRSYGTTGVNEEIGWYVPKYWADAHPTVIVPAVLNTDTDIHRAIIDAYTTASEINYLNYYDENIDSIRTRDGMDFYAYPNASRPIIWGSRPEYHMSLYSYNLTQNLLLGDREHGPQGLIRGLDAWDFIPIGSESKLSELVLDLYSKRLPFIANLYSPHLDFGVRIHENGTEVHALEFERIALPRNPSNSNQDKCYRERADCALAIEPYFVMATAKLSATEHEGGFPEIASLARRFALLSSDINAILGLQNELFERERAAAGPGAGNNLTLLNDMWLEATCTWMKANADTTAKWFVDISRYDCRGGCGFSYYYDRRGTVEYGYSKSNVKERIRIENKLEYVMGECTFADTQEECVCASDFLYDDCTKSCPGLLGPYLDWVSSNATTTASDSNSKHAMQYSIGVCSGHGRCDIEFRACDCEKGFGDDDCSVEFTQLKYEMYGVHIVLTVAFALEIVVMGVSIAWLHCNRRYKTISTMAVNMSILFAMGLIFVLLSDIVYLYRPLTDITCHVRFWLKGIGYILVICAPLLKVYRVTMIFRGLEKMRVVALPDNRLVQYLMLFMAAQLVLNVLYSVFFGVIGGGVKLRYVEEFYRIQYHCSNDETLYLVYAQYAYLLFLLLLLCTFSFMNRKSAQIFQEGRCAFMGSFFATFVILVVSVFNLAIEDELIIITVQSVSALITVAFIWVLFFGEKMYKFYKFPEQRNAVCIIPDHISRSGSGNESRSRSRSGSGISSAL